MNTTYLVEGTNLYYTAARARGAISILTAGSEIVASYIASTGILTFQPFNTNSIALNKLVTSSYNTAAVSNTLALRDSTGSSSFNTLYLLCGTNNITALSSVSGLLNLSTSLTSEGSILLSSNL